MVYFAKNGVPKKRVNSCTNKAENLKNDYSSNSFFANKNNDTLPTQLETLQDEKQATNQHTANRKFQKNSQEKNVLINHLLSNKEISVL